MGSTSLISPSLASSYGSLALLGLLSLSLSNVVGVAEGVTVCVNGREYCLDPLDPYYVDFASTVAGATCGSCNMSDF